MTERIVIGTTKERSTALRRPTVSGTLDAMSAIAGYWDRHDAPECQP